LATQAGACNGKILDRCNSGASRGGQRGRRPGCDHTPGLLSARLPPR
jgi:hypothetical protein